MQIVDTRSKPKVGTARARLAGGGPAVVFLALAATIVSACTNPRSPDLRAGAPAASSVALVRYTSCADALQNLRAAASRSLAAGGFADSATSEAPASAAGGQAPVAQRAGAATSGPPGAAGPGSYSTTNTATPGVDEPDIVKTEGRRIVTITGNVLRVVDAQTQQITGVLDLLSASSPSPPGAPVPDVPVPFFDGLTPANLLLFGTRALVMFNQSSYPFDGMYTGAGATGSAISANAAPNGSILGPQLALVDLSTGTPRIISEFTMDGALVDARQVGSVARVVVQSAPRFYIPPMESPGGQAGLAPERSAIAHAGLTEWLPRYVVTARGHRQSGLVNCASVSHPAAATYSGGSMLTVLTFDLTGTSLGDGEPVTIVADADTVYSDGASLYIASRQSATAPATGATLSAPPVDGTTSLAPAVGATGPVSPPVIATAGAVSPAEWVAGAQYTGIYKFDISGSGRPVYEASGTVPGWLLGSSGMAEYSLSAWNGALRVATTTSDILGPGTEQQSQSAVYVLEQAGNELVIVGKVGGLGLDEQIYAVRFVGPVGYLATFRQTDPLYTLDLSDPAQPKVAGQLLLTGYSAYLYPIDATHLIGVGQDATAQGQTTGTRISLFDVSDPAAPERLAVYDLQFGHSEAEFDPHAFLYWPASRLLVLPTQLPYGATTPATGTAQGLEPAYTEPAYTTANEAVVLHVGASGFTELGTISHPAAPAYPGGDQILRSLIIDNALWTLSDAGLKANDMTTLAPLGWVAF
jgi:hypothetical protein